MLSTTQQNDLPIIFKQNKINRQIDNTIFKRAINSINYYYTVIEFNRKFVHL